MITRQNNLIFIRFAGHRPALRHAATERELAQAEEKPERNRIIETR